MSSACRTDHRTIEGQLIPDKEASRGIRNGEETGGGLSVPKEAGASLGRILHDESGERRG